jgi:hypothetical protein
LDLAGSLSKPTPQKASLLSGAPLEVVSSRPSQVGFNPSSGVSGKPGPASPFTGRRPVGPSCRRQPRSFRTIPLRGLFFPLEAHAPVTRPT